MSSPQFGEFTFYNSIKGNYYYLSEIIPRSITRTILSSNNPNKICVNFTRSDINIFNCYFVEI